LKEAEQSKLSSNASIQDIIANSIEAYKTQEDPIEEDPIEDEEEEEEESSSSLSSAEESLTQQVMSLEVGDIMEVATIMTEGVKYRTDEGTKLNGDKIRKSFVKQLRKLLKDNNDFEDAFNNQFRNISQKNQKLTTLSAGKAPLMQTATEVLEKYVQAKEETGLDKTINLSGFGQTKIGDDMFPAI
jgi:hypothetical protein